jgi:hypothetical protein
MTDSTSYPVYLGTWINWSRGPVFGATLTLTRNDANLLIAFVAFFVAAGTVGPVLTCVPWLLLLCTLLTDFGA